METLKTSATVDEGSVMSELGQAQNSCDKTLEKVSGLSSLSEKCTGLVSALGVAVRENGYGASFNSENAVISNVEVAKKVSDIGHRVEVVEGGSLVSGVAGTGGRGKKCFNFGGIENGSLVDEAVVEGSRMKIGDVSAPEVCSTGNGNKAIGFVNVLTNEGVEEDDASQFKGVDSGRKLDVSRNGISLFVEVFGPLDGLVQGDASNCFGECVQIGSNFNQEYLCMENDALPLDNRESTSAEVLEVHDSMLNVTNFGTVDGKAEGGNGVEGEAIANQQGRFRVGGLVWAKTKTQSWWPGLIYDPSHAPKDAAKSHQRDSLLVRYFGNGSFVWCTSSQLKPFRECFEQMSRQSNSRNFLGAMERAVGQIGRRVKMEMTCSCCPKESRTTLAAGTKEGDIMPVDKMGELGEFSVTRFEPANFLSFVKDLAQDVSVPSMIEFAVIQNRLSAFYHSLGHLQLPMHQLRPTTDVKDGTRDGLASGVSVGRVLEKKDDELTKLFRQEGDVVFQKCGSDVADEGTISSIPATRSRNRERNKVSRDGSDEAEYLGICKVSLSEVQMTNAMTSSKSIESKVSCVENGDGGTDGKFEKGCESRERRKSKYLSPPYVNLNPGRKGLPILEEHETKDLEAVSVVGIEMNSTAGQSMGSTPMVKCSGSKKLQKKWTRKPITGPGVSVKPEEINASLAEMLSELRFAALDCLYPDESKNFDLADRFFSGFRRLAFTEDSNCEIANEHTVGQEMHLLQTLSESEVQTEKGKGMGEVSVEHWRAKVAAGAPDVNKTADPGSAGKKSHVKSRPLPNVVPNQRRRKKEETASVGSKTKSTAGLSDMKGNISTSGSVIIDFQKMAPLAPEGGSMLKKRKKKAGTTPGLSQIQVGLPDLNGNSTDLLLEVSHVTGPFEPQGKIEPKRRKGKEGAASKHPKSKSIADLPDLNGDSTGLPLEDSQVTGPVHPLGKIEPKRRKGKDGSASKRPKSETIAGLPDLNGNSTGLILGDAQVTGPVLPLGEIEPMRGKGKEGAASKRPKSKVITGLPDVEGSSATLGPMLKDVQVVGSYSLKGVPQLNNNEGMKEAVSLHPNTELTANQPDVNGNSAGPSSLLKDLLQMGIISPGGKPEHKEREDKVLNCQTKVTSANHTDVYGNSAEPSSFVKDPHQMSMFSLVGKPERKKRKRKVSDHQTGATSGIPDLNGNTGEPSSLGKELPETNCVPPEGKPQRKRRRRTKAEAAMSDINFIYNKVQSNGEALGTALLLKFCPEHPIPSKEALVSAFGVFGTLQESETQVLNDSCSGQVVFMSSSDARDAFLSLEKSSPFGPALVNYRLHHLSDASTSLEPNGNLPTDRFKTPPKHRTLARPKTLAKPPGMKPHHGEAPDLVCIRQNLEMMTSMLEKAGDNLSPEMRAKLESEIKGLLKKVSTMVGSSSSSS